MMRRLLAGRVPRIMALVVSVWISGGANTEEPNQQVGVGALAAQLRSGEVAATVEAAKRLGQLGPDAAPAVEELSNLLEHANPQVRAACVEALAAIGPPAAKVARRVIARLDDRDVINNTPIWHLAAECLGKMGPEVVPLLMEQLDPRHPQRYIGACAALQQIGPSAAAAVPKLIDLAMRDDADSQPALHALRGIGPGAKDALPTLLTLLDSRDFHNQYLACRVVGALGVHGTPAVEKLRELLRHGVASVRRNAAAALGQIGPQIGAEGIQSLVAALDDPLHPVREEAVIALGRLGPAAKSAIPMLKECATTDRRGVKARAAGALYRVDPQEVELVMAVLLREIQSPQAPWVAAEELAYVAPRAGRVADVAQLLRHADQEVRSTAADALGAMGKAAEPFLPELHRLANDGTEDAEVRQAAQQAISAIRQGTP